MGWGVTGGVSVSAGLCSTCIATAASCLASQHSSWVAQHMRGNRRITSGFTALRRNDTTLRLAPILLRA